MTTLNMLRPADADDLRDLVGDATRNGRVLEVRGGGSKADIGAPDRETTIIDMGAFAGVVDYEPSELVLTVRPATPLAAVEKLLAEHRQMLAFEPFDHGPLFGRAAGAATIGGVVAAGVGGPRRVTAGGARDHLLGFAAVSGRGEAFKGGGKVVKNVTGYDVAKAMAGSWGQLAILTELAVKVVPSPRVTVTVGLSGLTAPAAVAAMSKALGSRCAPAAAAHLPARFDRQALTAVRLEGFRESVDARATQLRQVLNDYADAVPLEGREGEDVWTAIREVRPLAAADTLWRAHIAPSRAAALVGALEQLGAQWLFDWAGALVWIGAPAGADVRSAVGGLGGHAMLVRAPLAVRRSTPARHPEAPAVAGLSARVKQAFDPAGVLDARRFT